MFFLILYRIILFVDFIVLTYFTVLICSVFKVLFVSIPLFMLGTLSCMLCYEKCSIVIIIIIVFEYYWIRLHSSTKINKKIFRRLISQLCTVEWVMYLDAFQILNTFIIINPVELSIFWIGHVGVEYKYPWWLSHHR